MQALALAVQQRQTAQGMHVLTGAGGMQAEALAAQQRQTHKTVEDYLKQDAAAADKYEGGGARAVLSVPLDDLLYEDIERGKLSGGIVLISNDQTKKEKKEQDEVGGVDRIGDGSANSYRPSIRL